MEVKISFEQLQQIYKEDAGKIYTYLKNKNKGGINNAKGAAYENLFAIYKIAEKFKEDETWLASTFFSVQSLCFVDDLIVELNNEAAIEYFQIKDVQTLSWSSGEHPIADDFALQFEISEASETRPILTLVVANKEVYEGLVNDLPEKIKDCATVFYFPKAESVSTLIKSNSLFRNELIRICALSNPGLDKLETLGVILLGAWEASRKQQVSLQELIDKCYQQNPHYIKGFHNKVSQSLATIFSGIEGFSYKIENGFIVWSYKSTDEGTVSFPIGSKHFEQWENDVLNAPITTFDELETYLT